MPEVKMFLRGHEIIIIGVYGYAVRVQRVDGGNFKVASTLRHHYGSVGEQPSMLTSMYAIKRQA